MNTKNKKAFTLVEMVVVVTILAILSTVGFVSYSSYLTWIRDTSRISNMESISNWLELYRAKYSLPLPEDKVEIKVNWSLIAYQWYAWANVLESIDFSNGWKDPKNDTYYSYYLTKNKKYFQIMWFLEDKESLAPTSLQSALSSNPGESIIDYSESFPMVNWNKLGLLTSSSNTPIQELSDIKDAWKIELDTTNSWTIYSMHTSEWVVSTFTWYILANKIVTLSEKSLYWPPKSCPEWFIASRWNSAFNQEWFCVAQYEMSYDETTASDIVMWLSRNGRKYNESKTLVSMTNRLPVTELTQSEAIYECSKLWKWYHLITNNEWMSIARQIEFNPENWSTWEVWDWFIPNWVTLNVDGHWCDWYQWDSNWDWMTLWAWITWSDCSWTNRNRLKLSNWVYIYDLAWNMWEHVNGANTLDWTDYNTMNANACWSWWTNSWDTYSYKNWELDTYPECEFKNWYSSTNIWPIIKGLNNTHGLWNIYSYKENDSITDRIFARGSGVSGANYTGIFSLDLDRYEGTKGSYLGFRCAYIKK